MSNWDLKMKVRSIREHDQCPSCGTWLRGSGPDIRLPMDIGSDVHNLRYTENLSG